MSKKGNKILDYFGESHAVYLHARGKIATNEIIELLKPQPGESILEVGFGTAGTLVQLASQYKNTNFFGYEFSDFMFEKGTDRIKFCQLEGKVKLLLLKEKNKFPALDNTFDKVYVESVIGIQEDDDFKNLIIEIERVLKPNGVLVFNETIWLESTNEKTIKDVNQSCKKLFGIIQANGNFPYLKNWTEVIVETGFKFELIKSVLEIDESSGSKYKSKHMFLSKIFTAKGKFKAIIYTSLKKQWRNYTKEISLLMDSYDQLMEGVIVKVRKVG